MAKCLQIRHLPRRTRWSHIPRHQVCHELATRLVDSSYSHTLTFLRCSTSKGQHLAVHRVAERHSSSMKSYLVPSSSDGPCSLGYLIHETCTIRNPYRLIKELCCDASREQAQWSTGVNLYGLRLSILYRSTNFKLTFVCMIACCVCCSHLQACSRTLASFPIF